ncbi:MAG: helix-turn-helix domain-containing protein [Alphaproteobacteria bacterium]|nr:helix-turn-helix domain-containing protein [Alphaproteobacteria bacterium]
MPTRRKTGQSRDVKSATRVLRVFEIFAETKRPMRISELAAELEIPQSSTSMLVHTLIRRGYMELAGQGRVVQPTLSLALLGSWLDEQFSQAGGLQEMLNEIVAFCQDTVLLGAEMGIEVHYVHVVQGNHPLRYDIKRGSRRFLVDANAGRVLLALKPDEEIDRLITRTQAERPHPPVDRRHLREEIETIRRQGYSYRENMVVPGASVIAAALRAGGLHRPLAVGIAGPTERLRANLQPNARFLMEVIAKYLGAPGRGGAPAPESHM